MARIDSSRIGPRVAEVGRRAGGRAFGAFRGLAAWVCLGCGTIAGCGTGPSGVATYPVEGRVVLADGKPLKGGRVLFTSKDLTAPDAVGEIASDGSFTLTTRERGDGAAAGDYRVAIEPPAIEAKVKAKARGRAPRLPFPGKYTDQDSSDLTVTVRAEPNRLEPIRLK